MSFYFWGDTGNPLVYNNQVVGVASFSTEPCAAGMSDIYTQVYSFRDFISTRVKK